MAVHVYPTLRCNLKCIHCIQESPNPEILRYRDLTLSEVLGMLEGAEGPLVLSGGEPTLYNRAYLFTLIREARRRGMDVILTTNATLLAPSYTSELMEAGVTRFAISVYGLGEKYDYVTRVPGAWERYVSGVRNVFRLREHYPWVEVEVKVLLTKVTVPDLKEIIDFFAQFPWKRGDRFLLVSPSLVDEFLKNIDVLGVRMSDVREEIREAVFYGRGKGLPIFLLRIPPCIVGEDMLPYILSYKTPERILTPERWDHYEDDTGYAEVCRSCRYYRNRCPGMRLTYIRYWGKDEFRPFPRGGGGLGGFQGGGERGQRCSSGAGQSSGEGQG